MAGLLSGLGALGFGNLENTEIFEDKKAAEVKKKTAEKAVLTVDEKDLIYDKQFKCPVCERVTPSKIMKTGRAKLLGMDEDLKPKYEGIESVKYDVILCTACGYAALSKFYGTLMSSQVKLIKENICGKAKLSDYNTDIYSFDQAIERYKMALVNAVVKKGKTSEKAYICLKTAWLIRGYADELSKTPGNDAKIEELKKAELENLTNAYEGFVEARTSENFPMCGMDESTMDVLLAEIAFKLKKYDVAGKLVSSLLSSISASARIKDKARNLKDRILEEVKSAE
ncbi:MAG: DUF2225 domain-containing protein [Acetatifactor sp.]|nr:DUF2225 domain-containing protein [Acetatifactor sp.]